MSRPKAVRITIKASRTFDLNDDWGFPEAYESGGVEGVLELIREDPVEWLRDMGNMKDVLKIEAIT